MTDVNKDVDVAETGKRLDEWTAEMREEAPSKSGNRGHASAPAEKGGNPIWRALTSDRGARWTSWVVIVAMWQLAGRVSEKFPTPVETIQHLVKEFRTPYFGAWSVIEQRARAGTSTISLWRALVGLACRDR